MTNTATTQQLRDAAAAWDQELLERLLNAVETINVTASRSDIIEAVAAWASDNEPSFEQAFCPLALLGVASHYHIVATKYAELDAVGYWAE